MANVIRKLQREAFVLTLQDRIAEAPKLDGYAVRLRNDHEIEVEVTKGQGLNRLFAELSAQALQVSSMRTKTNRLEELFIRLVEHKHGGNDA
jgi:ABC-2 type transport system ATP-binding protein